MCRSLPPVPLRALARRARRDRRRRPLPHAAVCRGGATETAWKPVGRGGRRHAAAAAVAAAAAPGPPPPLAGTGFPSRYLDAAMGRHSSRMLCSLSCSVADSTLVGRPPERARPSARSSPRRPAPSSFARSLGRQRRGPVVCCSSALAQPRGDVSKPGDGRRSARALRNRRRLGDRPPRPQGGTASPSDEQRERHQHGRADHELSDRLLGVGFHRALASSTSRLPFYLLSVAARGRESPTLA